MFEALAQGGAGDAEKFGGADLVLTGVFHGAAGEVLFNPGEEFHAGRGDGGGEKQRGGVFQAVARNRGDAVAACGDVGRGGLSERQIFGQENVGGGEDGGALDGVFQFADVAGPRIIFQHLDGFQAELQLRLEFVGGDAFEKIFGEQADVFLAVAQRRQVQAHDIEPVEQVFAELFGGDFFFEIFVGGGDDPDVGADGLIAADAGEGAVLQHAEEFALDGQRHVADFVEEEGAAVALFEAADALGAGTGE